MIRSQQHMVRSQNAIEKQREKQDKNPVYVQTPNVQCFLLLVLKIGLGLVVSDGCEVIKRCVSCLIFEENKFLSA